MSYFYTSPTSNIPSQPFPTAVRMMRTGSSSSTTSNSSTSSSISIPASSTSNCWSSSTSPSSPASPAYHNHRGHGHSRHLSNGTSYFPSPFRSSILHSAAATSSSTTSPSSYFSDDELLSLGLESTHLTSAPPLKREMTTEEQVMAVREQLERERDAAKPEAWWQQQHGASGRGVSSAAAVAERRSRTVRFTGDVRSTAAAPSGSGGKRNIGVQGKRKSVARSGSGKGSGRRD